MEDLNIVSLIQQRSKIAKRESQLLKGSRNNRGDGTIFIMLHQQRIKLDILILDELNKIEDKDTRDKLAKLLNNSPASVLKF